MSSLPQKILIANRGEIALRIARTAQKLHIPTTGIYSESDIDSDHYSLCDDHACLQGASILETYLNIPQIVEVAKAHQCDAIHPGYGFLSENADFARACVKNDIIFIGPKPEVIDFVGNKLKAKEKVKDLGIPVIEGLTGQVNELIEKCDSLQFPLLIKAAAGGGGKGMRIVHYQNDLENELENAAREAKSYFGDDTLYIERYLEIARHIEVQIIGDHLNNVIHLYHRECSLQRRYQKVIEEAPAMCDNETLERLLNDAILIAEETGYTNAGTIEFLVDEEGQYFFLEMNARIQVEHPITELVTGTDIVQLQIEVASGYPLKLKQRDVVLNGHAIESRIYAEDPANDFQPSPGIIQYVKFPENSAVRVDTWVSEGTTILPDYDSLLAKVISYASTREKALNAHKKALADLKILGIETNTSFLKAALDHNKVQSLEISTRFLEKHQKELTAYALLKENSLIDALAVAIIVLLLKTASNGSIWNEIGYWRGMPQMILYGNESRYELIYELMNDSLEFVLDETVHRYELRELKDHSIRMTQNEKLIEAIYCKADGIIFVSIDNFQFSFNDQPKKIVGDSSRDFPYRSNNHIESPLPGRVSKVLIAEGQTIKKDDNLLIIEAMKMDHYIKAFKDGLISNVTVKQGDIVSANETLVVYKDLDQPV